MGYLRARSARRLNPVFGLLVSPDIADFAGPAKNLASAFRRNPFQAACIAICWNESPASFDFEIRSLPDERRSEAAASRNDAISLAPAP